MKKYIRSGAFDPDYNEPATILDDEEEFIPPKFDEAFVDNIINRIRTRIKEKYTRRFPNMFVEFDDEWWGSKAENGGRMHVAVIIYSNGEEKAYDTFEFYAQDSYWDKLDYEQDIDMTVNNFVDNISVT